MVSFSFLFAIDTMGDCLLRNMKISSVGIWCLGFCLLLGCAGSRSGAGNPRAKGIGDRPRNLILMIGDGMGLSQITYAHMALNRTLAVETFPVTGLIRTPSASDDVTDSGAAATAYATGYKTYNGAIGVDVDTVPRPTILEDAHAAGLKTGLVVTVELVHATPAAFYAHQYTRRYSERIADDLTQADVDLLIGGGIQYFLERRDQRNLLKVMKERQYMVRSGDFRTDFYIAPDDKLLYFTAKDRPATRELGREYLPEATDYACRFLRDRGKKGFFMMVEGSQIDLAGHSNNLPLLLSEMDDFDQAVAKALEFAKSDGKTLVIVTGDHETGGLALKTGREPGSIDPSFASGNHTATMIPVFAYGPGASNFAGVYENTDLYLKMMQALDLESSDQADP
ncbi:alkaline phosphatase [Pontibacter sp. G13]|uniref:alkaline phosphatase n=1 Tax=Pontibacter sp. G13 TaxID=3074898 RepID=UPI00288A84CB|nr:alkaline phosphatase [Pontibacter sp. G13]WNJ20660.1 alkaline phosphatase [Pontibacter sp. G13]